MADRTFELDGESVVTQAGIAALFGSAPASDDGLADAAAEIRLAGVLDGGLRATRDEAHRTEAFIRVGRELHELRASLDPAAWARLVPAVKSHALCSMARLDPMMRRSAEKPRGYSGDAVMLDFLYRHPDVQAQVEAACAVGRDVLAYSLASNAADAVRERREILAALVDEVATTKGAGTEVLTIAAGHLREAPLARSLADGAVGRWVALDQDPSSVEGMRGHLSGTAVEPFEGSVKGVMSDAYDLGKFDLVYAAGLYDYLPDAVAVRLTRKCLSMLKPGGTFMFANFAPGGADDAVMETFMDWSLILRDDADVEQILRRSAFQIPCDVAVWAGIHGDVIYGKATLAS